MKIAVANLPTPPNPVSLMADALLPLTQVTHDRVHTSIVKKYLQFGSFQLNAIAPQTAPSSRQKTPVFLGIFRRNENLSKQRSDRGLREVKLKLIL